MFRHLPVLLFLLLGGVICMPDHLAPVPVIAQEQKEDPKSSEEKSELTNHAQNQIREYKPVPRVQLKFHSSQHSIRYPASSLRSKSAIFLLNRNFRC